MVLRVGSIGPKSARKRCCLILSSPPEWRRVFVGSLLRGLAGRTIRVGLLHWLAVLLVGLLVGWWRALTQSSHAGGQLGSRKRPRGSRRRPGAGGTTRALRAEGGVRV
jgi:hypothetical protein